MPFTADPPKKSGFVPDQPDSNPAISPDTTSDGWKAAIHGRMLDTPTDYALQNKDAIDQQMRLRDPKYDDGKLDPTIMNDFRAGYEGSVLGLTKNKKLPQQVRNPGLVDKFVSGVGQFIGDVPFMLAGAVAGGAAGSEVPIVGNAIGAGAGAFALPAVARQALIEGITKGTVTSFPDILRRMANVVKEGGKGAAVGAATELSGGLPVGSFVAKSGLATTAVKSIYQATALTTTADLLEGKLPTKEDFAGNAALIVPLNLITHGVALRSGETNQALMDVYAKDGKTPSESTQTLHAQPTVKPDLPEGLRPAIDTGDGFVDGDTAESHAGVSERVLAKKPVSMEQLETEPDKADQVLENPKIHDQDVIDKAWQLKSDEIDAEGVPDEDKAKSIEQQQREQEELAAERKAAGEDPGEPTPPKEPQTIDELYDRSSMKSGRGFVTPDGEFLSRSEARKWTKDNEPDVHETWLEEVEGDKQAEFHSEAYGIARMRVSARNLAEGDPTISNLSLQAASRLSAAREGLNKIKAGDASKGYGKEVLRTLFVGQRDTRIAATTQLRDSLKALIPDFHDQEALSILRDYKGTPDKLAADLDSIRAGDSERMKGLIPSIERAMNPTPELLEADQKLTDYYTAALDEGRQLGFMESTIDPSHYSPHILTRILEGEKPSSRTGKAAMSKSTPFAKERSYPTILDALKTGHLDARTVNALDSLSVYGDRHATVVATKLFETELKNTQLGQEGTKDDHPSGWERLAGENSFYVPKDVADAMKPMFESGLKGTSLAPLLKAQGYVKALELGLSFFHVKALNITAFNNMALTDFTKALTTDTKSLEFAEAERGWAADGLTTAKTSTPYEAYEGLSKSSIPTGLDKLADAPVVKQVDEAFKGITKYTFEVVQRKFKVQDASLKDASWQANHPDATNEEYFSARRSIAKEVNAAYGGLNWDVLGTGKTVRDVSRLFLLAPDWTFSNVLNAKYSFEGGPAGSAARRFWAKSFATGIAMTAAMSYAIGGKYDPTDAKHFDQVYLGKDEKGKDMYANWFFAGAPKDAMTLVKRSISDTPLAGTAEFIVSKASPALGLLGDVAYNKRGGSNIPIRNTKDSSLKQTGESAAYAVERVVPITGVSAVKTVEQALTDPNHEYSYRDLLELAADVLGSPTTHSGVGGGTTKSKSPTPGLSKGRGTTPLGKPTRRK